MSGLTDASWIASLLAVDAHRLGGVCLRSGAGPLRDQWLQLLRYLLPAAAPLRRVPCTIAESRLLGGLDLAATLRANRPIAERGVLALADGGIVVVSMAERLSTQAAATFSSVLDRGTVQLAREGVSFDDSARIGVIALDEGIAEDEFPPPSLLERLAFWLDFTSLDVKSVITPLHDPDDICAARQRLAGVEMDDAVVRALCATALGLGAGSPRVTLLAVQAARIVAALEERVQVTEQDAVLAGRLVLAPRASIAPQAPAQSEPPVAQPDEASAEESGPAAGNSAAAPADQRAEPAAESTAVQPQQALEDVVLAAVQANIPGGLLARLRAHGAMQRASRNASMGRAGSFKKGGSRGRPAGVSAVAARTSRLNLIETLRTAAPWQRLRGRSSPAERLRVTAQDFRVTRYKQRSQTLTVFAVDASGSSALNRLAETKGAVELLLADCYIRRDQVAVIAFRGSSADIVLPPTRSLVRAKRSLAALPGGGGTPLAHAIDAAVVLAGQACRRGETATVVMLTDGRANVGRGGKPGRDLGQQDALKAADGFRNARIQGLFIDTSPRPNAMARDLAARMNATYVALPFADARSLSNIVAAARD